MLVTPTTTPITGPRVLSVTVTESPVLNSTTGASILSEGAGLESAVVSSVATATQSEISNANEVATTTANGALTAPFISVGTETSSVVTESNAVAGERGFSTQTVTVTSKLTSSVRGENTKALLFPAITTQDQERVFERSTGAEQILANANENASVFELGRTNVQPNLASGIGTVALSDVSAAVETLSSTLLRDTFANELGNATEQLTSRAIVIPSTLNEVLSVLVASSLTAAEGGTVKEKGIIKDTAVILGNANALFGESGFAKAQATVTSKLKTSSIFFVSVARENVLSSASKDGLLNEITRAFVEASVNGVGKLNFGNPLLRISPQIRLIATESGNVFEQGSTTETSVLSGISLPSTTESGQAVSQPLLTGTFLTGSNESGIGQEVSNLKENTSLGATELALLNSVLTSAVKGQGNVKELGTTFEFTTLNNNSIPKLADEGRTVSSAFLKAKSDAFSVEAALAPESLSSSSNLSSAFTEAGQATELPSALANGLLNAGETAQATEQGRALGKSDTFIIEIGDAVASLLPVRLNGDADASFAEIGRTGEAAVLRGMGNLNAVTSGKKFVATLLKAATGEDVTESGMVVPQVTATATSKTTSILPTLLANEGAVLNAIAQTSFSETVPQRIAEIQAVLKDTMGINASMTDAIIIDTIIRD